MIQVPNGIILITGATGSGKSTTTYTMLKTLNTEDVNIITTATPIFGGVDNKAKGNKSENTIYIKGTVLFGGIEIK